ncbi:hypothetical protein Tco_0483471 [Tanacetum coccineum]
METIQAFLKEYDHIPPEEKFMALLFAEERFLKIKQAAEEEQNQPGVMQELLLKLMDDLQVLKGIQPKQEEPAVQSFTPYENFSMIDDVEVLMKDIYTFLRKFSHISFGVTPKVILIAWERFGEIKHSLTDKQYQQEDIQEFMSKLLEDVRNISEELSEYINCPSWNRPIFYDNDDDAYIIIYSKPKAITPDLPTVEPDNSLSMGDEHLDTIPSVENLVLIPSESKGISDDTCDMPVGEDSSTFDALNDHSEILSDSNDDGTSSDDNDFEDIEYVSLEEVNDVDQEENEFDLEDILQIQDVIMVRNFPISVPRNSNSFFEKSDTSFSFSDNSLPEFETFSDHTEETRSGSTTTHAITLLHDGYHDSKGDIHYLESLLSDNITLSVPPKVFLDHDPRSLSNDFKIMVKVFDPGIQEKNFSPTYESLTFEDHHYLSFTYVIRTFLLYFTYPVVSPFPLSSGSEDIIFDPGISAFHFSSLEPVAFKCPMEVCSSTCFIPNFIMIWGESS